MFKIEESQSDKGPPILTVLEPDEPPEEDPVGQYTVSSQGTGVRKYTTGGWTIR